MVTDKYCGVTISMFVPDREAVENLISELKISCSYEQFAELKKRYLYRIALRWAEPKYDIVWVDKDEDAFELNFVIKRTEFDRYARMWDNISAVFYTLKEGGDSSRWEDYENRTGFVVEMIPDEV